MLVLGAFTVLFLHIFGFFIDQQKDFPWTYDVEAITIVLLRFGRSVFVFATGMLLFYWYQHKTVDWRAFWRKRWYAIILPYMIWTAIYTYFRQQSFDFALLLPQFLQSLFNGSSFYHLYYIPVYLQLTLLFMFTKSLFEKHLRLPLLLFLLFLQVGIYSLSYYYFTSPLIQIDWNSSSLTQFIHFMYQDGQLFFYHYVFYFALGAYAGMHVETWRSFVARYRYYSLALYIGTGIWIALRYLSGQASYTESADIFQPLYLLYTISFILSVYPISATLGKHERLQHLLAKLASQNMAIYIVHPLVLFLLESYVIYDLPMYVPMLSLFMFAVTLPASILLYHLILPANWRKLFIGKKQASHPQVHSQQA